MNKYLSNPNTIKLVHMNQMMVSNYWNLLGTTIKHAFDNVTKDSLVTFMARLLNQTIEAWVIFEVDEDSKFHIVGFAVTGQERCRLTNSHRMMIYAMATIGGGVMSLNAWRSAEAQLVEIAKSRGCNQLMAMSNNKRAIDIATKNGWNTDTILLHKEL